LLLDYLNGIGFTNRRNGHIDSENQYEIGVHFSFHDSGPLSNKPKTNGSAIKA